MRRRFWGSSRDKQPEYYKGILMMADTGLHEQIAGVICGVLPAGSSVLDLGCGQGALSERLKDSGYSVLSVDSNAEAFRASTLFQQLDFNDKWALHDFVNTHTETFDLVIGVEVIEHIENPWEYIRTLSGMVKPRGRILVSTPNVTSWYSRAMFLFSGRFHQFNDPDRAYGHINPVALDELGYIGKELGLEVERVIPGGWLPSFWIERSLRNLVYNLVGLVTRPFMQGQWRGWTIIVLLRKRVHT